jgi:hypothetical protein
MKGRFLLTLLALGGMGVFGMRAASRSLGIGRPTQVAGAPVTAQVAPPTVKVAPQSGKPKPPAVGTANARSTIGYNLDFPGDWSNLMPFIDLMHDARPWMGACGDSDPHCDPYAHLDLDARGWPRSLRYRDDPTRAYAAIETVFSTQQNVPDVGRRFTITWEGEGDFTFLGVDPVDVDRARHRITFLFRPGNKFVRIVRTDPRAKGDYVRNVKIFREDRTGLIAAGEIFNPDMLDYLKPFGSLRFMDWMLSNNEEKRDALWSERPQVGYFQWQDQLLDPTDAKPGHRVGGYPVEVLVALANRTGADPHFNMPYRYTDDWVVRFAQYVRDELAPNLRATVEYSNEVWNWGFPQATYAKERAQELWPGEGTGWLQFMGMRAARMCHIWRQVFAGQEQRLRCVIAPQTGWPDVAEASLDCPRWVAMDPEHHKPCHRYADAVAVTGYFSGFLGAKQNQPLLHEWLAKGRDFAMSKALQQLEQGDVPGLVNPDGKPAVGDQSDSLKATVAAFGRFRRYARARGLELYVYEGGTHLDSDDPGLKDFFFQMTEQDKMRTLYGSLFDGYRAAEGTVFNCWGWIAPRDPWANAQTVLDRSRTKYRAIVDFVAKNPCWWPACDRSAR